jgi:hypothetical protein
MYFYYTKWRHIQNYKIRQSLLCSLFLLFSFLMLLHDAQGSVLTLCIRNMQSISREIIWLGQWKYGIKAFFLSFFLSATPFYLNILGVECYCCIL